MEQELVKKDKKKISKKKRNNAILYPIYKMFSWDLLSFYSIEFLFYTITKGISASQVLILTSLYIIFKIIFQIPTVAISEYLGKRKSIILGNIFVVLYLSLLIISSDFSWMIIAVIFSAFGFNIKTISEGNLLYDSVSTRGGDGIYTKIDSRGTSGYYILDTIFSVVAGYLFLINNYIPIYISLFLTIIALILSFRFKDIYKSNEKKSDKRFFQFFKGYSVDIKDSFRFIKRSNRMRSYLIFAAIFYGTLKVMSTYKNNLLTDIGVSAELFSMIYAILSLLAAISSIFARKVQRKFKNKTLTLISLSYILSLILASAISIKFADNIALPFILILYMINKMADSQWWVTQYTYLKNFTTAESRMKITFTYELIISFVASVMAMVGATILKYINIKNCMLIVGLLILAILVVVLDYMRTRFGLKPKEYTQEDIKFYIKEKKKC